MDERNEILLPVRGPAGEPFDLRHTLQSHGVASLPPNRVAADGQRLDVALLAPESGARLVTVESESSGDMVRVSVAGLSLSDLDRDWLTRTLRQMLRLDVDLSGFYQAIGDDEALTWATIGAGRFMRGSTVFEDVVKTICTTNTTWSATERMVGALVTNLGQPTSLAEPDSAFGRTFPTPEVLAEAPDSFYRETVRTGYRGAYIKSLANQVASGELDLESLVEQDSDRLSDDEARRQLLALPGVGPYAAAHIMMLIGRHDPLILDSWTRPAFARLSGETLNDKEIVARFARYSPHAGLAFWLYVTREWFAPPVVPPETMPLD